MNKEYDIRSLLLALLVNVLAIGLLLLMGIDMPERQGESGVPVMMGNVEDPFADYSFTPVEPAPPPAPSAVMPVTAVQAEPVITQSLEETVAIEDGSRKVQAKPEVKQPTEEELRAERERIEREKAQAIDNNLASLFAKSSSMQAAQGQSESAASDLTPGSVQGNASQGKLSGTGAYGTWDLGGRDPEGSLPKPSYNVQEEGCVVVTITVNPEGNVVSTQINKRTNTMSEELRTAALKAAKMTKFSRSGRPDNQTGTITYYFKLQ